ncbi:MAG: PEP-CTERM system TPR-repeat protein PrsT [Rhizobiales bacterium]|nr:PEP-CTERM system TPR-repeat protein PrsT [Hyphomicrobiales bacterium]
MNRLAMSARRHITVLCLPAMAFLFTGLATDFAAVAAVPSRDAALQSSSQVEKWISDARLALRQRNVRLASIHLRNATRAAPGNAVAQVMLSQILLQAQDVSGAERTLREALKSGAPETGVLPALLQIMLVRGENRQLLEEFPDPGFKASPVAADILKARAFAFQGISRPAEASAAMDRSLALRKDGQGLLAKARLSQQQGDLLTAKSFADQAVRIDPNNSAAAIFQLNLLRALKQNAAALDLANKLLARTPADARARLARIEIFLSQNQDQKAKDDIDSLLKQIPNLPPAIYYRALLLERSGRSVDAWTSAQNLPSEFVDSSPRVGIAVAKIAMNADKLNAGEVILGRIIGKWPDSVEARLVLASLRLEQGSPNSALSVLEPLKDSADPAVIKLLARAYSGLDRTKDTAAALKKLGSTGTGAEPSASRQALQELQMGRAEVAAKLLRPLVAKDPQNPSLASALIGALIQLKRYPEAIDVADKMGIDPKQRTVSLIYKGDILALQNKMDAARIAFDQAVTSSPRDKSVLLSRANFFTATQQYPQAERDLQLAASLDAKDYQPILKLAAISALLGQDKKARAQLQKAVDIAPQNQVPRLTMARYLLDRRDAGAAMKVANDLVRLQPSNGEAFALKGQVELQLGKTNEAVESFRRFATLSPGSAAPQIMLSKALSAKGDQPGAMAAMRAAIKMSPQSPEIKAAQIELLLAQGNVSVAVSEAQAFRKASPGTSADMILSTALIKAGRLNEAASILEKSFSDRPDAATLSKLVQVLFAARESKKAETLLARWLKQNPDDLAMRLQYADLLLRGNDLPKAKEQYEAVLKRDSTNLVAVNNFSWLIQTSNPKRALELLSGAEKRFPNSADIADTTGWILLAQKDVAKGLKYIERAHALSPSNEQTTFHFAVALDANARRDQARNVLKTLLAGNVGQGVRGDAQKLYDSWR